MREYHKINTIYKRDEKTKRIVEGDWSTDEFAFLAECQWEWTEKVDGTNVRVMWDGENVTFGGKTDNAQIPVKLLYALQALFEGTANREKLKATFDCPACLYGEGYGQSIQKVGSLYAPECRFVLFDVRVGDWWLRRSDVVDVGSKTGCQVVPVVGSGTLIEAAEFVRTPYRSAWGGFDAEGLVMRPSVPLYDRKGYRVIAKIKSRDFKA
jgi:hypothetical protein